MICTFLKNFNEKNTEKTTPSQGQKTVRVTFFDVFFSSRPVTAVPDFFRCCEFILNTGYFVFKATAWNYHEYAKLANNMPWSGVYAGIVRVELLKETLLKNGPEPGNRLMQIVNPRLWRIFRIHG